VHEPYDAADRIDVLRRRLQFLEVRSTPTRTHLRRFGAPSDAVVEADVSDLQQGRRTATERD
jgi:hypothetical protein